MTRVYLSEAEKLQRDYTARALRNSEYEIARDAAFLRPDPIRIPASVRQRRYMNRLLFLLITACVVGGFLLGLAFALQFPHLIPIG